MKARMLFTSLLAVLILAMSQGCAVYKFADKAAHEVVGFAMGDGRSSIVIIDGSYRHNVIIIDQPITFTVDAPQLGNRHTGDVIPYMCYWSWSTQNGEFRLSGGKFVKKFGTILPELSSSEGKLNIRITYQLRETRLDHNGIPHYKWWPYAQTVSDTSVTISSWGNP